MHPYDGTKVKGKDVATIELPVFHGTRGSCTLAVADRESRAAPIAEQIAAVAPANDVPVGVVRSHRHAIYRFAGSDQRPVIRFPYRDPHQDGRWAKR